MSVKQTFWQLLDSYDVEIPIIQRDYAQGRSDAKATQIRQGFVQSLYEMVTNPAVSTDLDFIYGSVKNDVLVLLDGQQRLTTLFLLHWYVSTGTQALEAREKLAKFRYETRVSSREFIGSLLTFSDDFDLLAIEGSLSEKIKDAHWFFSIWGNDPTVQSMLTMLDEIHRVFRPALDESEALWGKLVCNENPPVTFHFLNMDDFSLTDELYIKMNARGRALTEFENFKAWLQGYSEKIESEEIPKHFWHAMDKEWTDVFWQQRESGMFEIDDIYLRFFKSVALANVAKALPLPSKKLSGKDDALVNLLRNGSYVAVQHYVENDSFTAETLTQLASFLDFMHKLQTLTGCEGESDLKLLCRELFNDVLKKKGQLEQVRFYAFYLYVALVDENEAWDVAKLTGLADWLAIALRLINNTSFDSSADYVRAIHSLNDLSDCFEGDILQNFAAKNAGSISFFNEQQRNEEIVKSNLIVNDSDWKSVLQNAESHGYFYGQVGFLLDSCIDPETGGYCRDTFISNANKASVLFSDSLIETNDLLLQRALLSIGDYTIPVGSNYSFCKSAKGNARDRNENWRRVFNDKKHRQKLLFELLSKLKEGEEEQGLIDIVTSTNTKDWRQYFIKYPEVIGSCKERQARFNYDSDVYLLKSLRMSGKHKGLMTYVLYLELLNNSNPELANLKSVMKYVSVSGDSLAPGIMFTPWQGGDLHIEYDEGFSLELLDSEDEELQLHPCKGIQIIRAMFPVIESIGTDDEEELKTA
ncbi:MAG: DUF262 domain-containing protein [Pseudomonadales bacterium]|nr:DUF262 domain-containing protein [Pseudomonadales bacterium]